jgi:hypothetical protein
MSIIDARLVQIGMSTREDDRISRLKLDYQGHTYDLVRVVATHKLDPARAGSQWQQEIDPLPTGCLMVAEANYYSLWTIECTSTTSATTQKQTEPNVETGLELQQASIWLLQELWVQWESSLGAKQSSVIAQEIVAATPALRSRLDFDRLLEIDPLTKAKLANWFDPDFESFARHLYHIARHKLGRQFGTELTIEIARSMPALLQVALAEILEI